MKRMILDTLENSSRYENLHSRFARAFGWLRETDFALLPDGKHPIDGDEIFAIVEKSNARGREKSPLEVHRKYIDIQFVIAGEDEIGWRSLGDCHAPRGAFDEARDIVFFDDAPQFYAKLAVATFAIYFSDDAHAPLAGNGVVRKAVIKIAMN